MSPDLLRLKMQALLHEPPEGALLAERVRPGHAYRSLLLGEAHSEVPEAVQAAQRLAEGTDETPPGEPGLAFAEQPVLRHPLSGHEMPLRELLGHGLAPDTASLGAVVEQVVRQIQRAHRGDLKKQYLSLWRSLPERLNAVERGVPWSLLPADPRRPDVPRQGEAELVSALAGAHGVEGERQAALLLFTIGPVQDFIAAARKTSDLWAGSYLLSFLAWQAIRVICKACGPDAVLFPVLYGQPLTDLWLHEEIGFRKPESLSAATFPNRFFAVVPEDRADELAREARTTVQEAFKEIGRFGCRQLDLLTSGAETQLDHFIECYWAVLPMPQFTHAPRGEALADAFEEKYAAFFEWDDLAARNTLDAAANVGALYGRLYKMTEALVGSRKALRDFIALPETGYRCSHLPVLAALVPSATARPGEVNAFWREKAADAKRGKIRQGERLSAVMLAKRFFPEYLEQEAKITEIETGFPSTSTLAVADFKADVIDRLSKAPKIQNTFEGLYQAVGVLRKQFGVLRDDTPLPRLKMLADGDETCEQIAKLGGEWFFAETYDAERLQREYALGAGAVQDADLQDARNKLRAFLEATEEEATEEAGIEPPSKYYALIALDGDHMGRWLSGQQLGQPPTPLHHRAVSEALGHFALRHVPRIVEQEHLGRLVYSGGDDVLAFVSFRDALLVARALRAAFSGHLDAQGQVDWMQQTGYVQTADGRLLAMGPNATASAGVVIAHHQQPLRQVLAQAHAAEKYAKNTLNRDALALAVMKRSGETITTGTKWTNDNRITDLVDALDRFTNLIRVGLVSTKLVYELETEAVGLAALAGSDAEPVRLEARRLFMRHTENMRYPKDTDNLAWLQAVTDAADPDHDALRAEAFAQTLGVLLRHNDLNRTIGLLDAAQFLGLGGAR